MKQKSIMIGGVIGALILSAISISLIYHKSVMNQKELVLQDDIIIQQQEREKHYSNVTATFDEPEVIVNPYGNAPLTALVIFTTEEAVTPKVTIQGKDEQSTFHNTFKKNKKHYLPIYGLYAGQENKVIIEYELAGTMKEKILLIQTEALPDDAALPTEVYADKDKLTNDLYFFTPSSMGYTCAYDSNGDIRWYLTNYALWKIDRLQNGHMLVSTDRLINTPYYMTGLYEIDMLGKIYTEYSLPGGYHHDYFEMPNGNLLVASDDFTSGNGTVEDYIVELDRKTGKVVKTFDLKDILNTEDGKSENWTEYDWFHNNAVWYDEKTNSITLSGRHQDAVINLDYQTGTLNWIIGDPTNWSDEYQKYFFQPVGDDFEWQWSQHAAMITPEGYVFLLDNGNNKSKEKDQYVKASDSYTRGVMYRIDPKQMTIEQVWEYGKDRGSEFYSPYISDVDYLDQNHYIVHSGGIVYVDGKNSNQPAGFSKNATLVSDTVELLDDEVIFELKLPTNNYRVEKMGVYPETEDFHLGKASRLGTLGKTPVTKSKYGWVISKKKTSAIADQHQLKITKEIDRLVVTGKFKKTDQVNIMLYQNFRSYVYQMKISKKPYTALCVDVFSEEEDENGIVVTKYVNAEGLSGAYSIYLEVNGTMYDTGQYIKF